MAPTPAVQLLKVAEADFPSRFGHFRIFGFEAHYASGVEESVVLRMGDMSGDPPLVRIHSQCLTGDVFHSLRCDCRAQLELALYRIGEEGRGLLIYEHQEGRGIGLMNKLRAYELQDGGADTVEANEQLGIQGRSADVRAAWRNSELFRSASESGCCRTILRRFTALERAGIEVVERVPCQVPPTATTEDYLRTKREKLGHLL